MQRAGRVRRRQHGVDLAQSCLQNLLPYHVEQLLEGIERREGSDDHHARSTVVRFECKPDPHASCHGGPMESRLLQQQYGSFVLYEQCVLIAEKIAAVRTTGTIEFLDDGHFANCSSPAAPRH
jgi:hypothetical protein